MVATIPPFTVSGGVDGGVGGGGVGGDGGVDGDGGGVGAVGDGGGVGGGSGGGDGGGVGGDGGGGRDGGSNTRPPEQIQKSVDIFAAVCNNIFTSHINCMQTQIVDKTADMGFKQFI